MIFESNIPFPLLHSNECLYTSGFKSHKPTIIVITILNLCIIDDTSFPQSEEEEECWWGSKWCKHTKAKNIPADSANPEILAKSKDNHGLWGLAARQGMAIAIPSGMFYIAMETTPVLFIVSGKFVCWFIGLLD